MKKVIVFLLVLSLLTLTAGCSSFTQTKYSQFSNTFYEAFNTLSTVVAFTETEEEFNDYFNMVKTRFEELHKLYDIYNTYDGINNLKTINDNAGIAPVKVDQDIIDLIKLSVDWNRTIGPNTNIALGSVLTIWRHYREDGIYDPSSAVLPPRDMLETAFLHTDLDNIIIDEENSTIFLSDSKMRLDVGAVAKGYAAEIVAREVEAAGMISGIINAGGNIRTIGKPLDGSREKWGVGIFNPNSSLFSEDRNLDTVFVNNASVVSSGDYQRYYVVDGQILHHLIDPKTLMPGDYYRAVTVISPDSGYADFVSSELFFMPYEESRLLADSLDDVEAIWVMPDGEVRFTDGMKEILASQGATSSGK